MATASAERAHNDNKTLSQHHKHAQSASIALLARSLDRPLRRSGVRAYPLASQVPQRVQSSGNAWSGRSIYQVVNSVADSPKTRRLRKMDVPARSVHRTEAMLSAAAISNHWSEPLPSGAYTAAKHLDVEIQEPYVSAHLSEGLRSTSRATNAYLRLPMVFTIGLASNRFRPPRASSTLPTLSTREVLAAGATMLL